MRSRKAPDFVTVLPAVDRSGSYQPSPFQRSGGTSPNRADAVAHQLPEPIGRVRAAGQAASHPNDSDRIGLQRLSRLRTRLLRHQGKLERRHAGERGEACRSSRAGGRLLEQRQHGGFVGQRSHLRERGRRVRRPGAGPVGASVGRSARLIGGEEVDDRFDRRIVPRQASPRAGGRGRFRAGCAARWP